MCEHQRPIPREREERQRWWELAGSRRGGPAQRGRVLGAHPAEVVVIQNGAGREWHGSETGTGCRKKGRFCGTKGRAEAVLRRGVVCSWQCAAAAGATRGVVHAPSRLTRPAGLARYEPRTPKPFISCRCSLWQQVLSLSLYLSFSLSLRLICISLAAAAVAQQPLAHVCFRCAKFVARESRIGSLDTVLLGLVLFANFDSLVRACVWNSGVFWGRTIVFLTRKISPVSLVLSG